MEKIGELLVEFLHNGKFLTVLGAALAAILPGIGSAKAVSAVGEALDGLMSDDPDKFGKGFLLQCLPATQGLYGFIVAFLCMGQLSSVDSFEKGIYYLGACLPIMVCGMYSAIKQGKVAAAGIVTISKRPEASGKTVTATAMVELYALLALIISILLVTNNPF